MGKGTSNLKEKPFFIFLNSFFFFFTWKLLFLNKTMIVHHQVKTEAQFKSFIFVFFFSLFIFRQILCGEFDRLLWLHKENTFRPLYFFSHTSSSTIFVFFLLISDKNNLNLFQLCDTKRSYYSNTAHHQLFPLRMIVSSL